MKRVAVLLAFMVIAGLAAVLPPGMPTEAQNDCFGNGFCITNPAFAQYFRERGGRNIFGDAISSEFTLEGFRVQFFQRVILQLQGNLVQRINVLDNNIMPMTRVNQSVFPPNDPALQAAAPQNPQSPTYADEAIAFIQRVSPNTYNGINVGFFDLFNNTVPVDIAFPGTTPSPGLVTLANLEIWGLPTSQPAPDPGNGGFIYQRYQRGIMHYEDTCRCSHGILVGQYFKAVITGVNLPPDLDQDMRGSRFYHQYSPGSPGSVARPGELPNTDMTGAFEAGIGPAPQPQPQPGGATATPTTVAVTTSGTTITVQLDDDTIDPGQSVTVTLIANHTAGIDWIEFEGVYEGNDNNQNDNEAAGDAALARQRLDCDDNLQCAKVITITPTIPGRYTIQARLRDVNDLRTDWIGSASLRVRGQTGATPTATTTATAGTTATATATAGATNPPAPTATATPTP